MTEPEDPQGADLIDFAVPYALHALAPAEREDVEQRVFSSAHIDAFFDEVRAVRETMAAMSAATAVEPPASLRDSILAAVSTDNVTPLPTRRWRPAVLAAAAALLVGLAAVGIGLAVRPPPPQQSTAQQIFTAPDVRTVSGDIPTGGTATVVFSRDRDAGVLVMNNVTPPQPGTVYQMWLVHGSGVTSAGTMNAQAVSPSTTAVLPDLGDSTALAFTVEPGAGSPQPTGQVFARLPLI